MNGSPLRTQRRIAGHGNEASATAGDDANAPARARAHTDRRITLKPPSTEHARTPTVTLRAD
jgi:hypothetical protein